MIISVGERAILTTVDTVSTLPRSRGVTVVALPPHHHTTTPPHATRRATRIQRPKPVYNFRLARLRRRLRRRVELFITSGVRVRKRVCSGTREILPLTGTHCRCRARSRVHANNRACKYLFYPPLVDSARAVCCNTKKNKTKQRTNTGRKFE